VTDVPRGTSGVGDLHPATVVVNVQDMLRAVDFWCAARGYRVREEAPDPRFTMLVHPDGRGLPVSLQPAEQARHVERLVGLGATRATDWPYPDDPDFVVLRDPDGNEFCVIDHPGL
jgi:catechol 2,3-dioxygenase-like lactoylglutathione lyase family enzyme